MSMDSDESEGAICPDLEIFIDIVVCLWPAPPSSLRYAAKEVLEVGSVEN